MINQEQLYLKQTIKELKHTICNEFSVNASITHITRKLIETIDNILHSLFQKHALSSRGGFALIALGSYGRRELQLHSDIDLLLLHRKNIALTDLISPQTFIQDCWDIGLEPSHQITTPEDCADLAAMDLSVMSSIMDARLICGRGALLEELIYLTQPLNMWRSHDYFFAKIKEQNARYDKYDETAYNLEPNVKYSPGGLRDLQILLSISKRHFGIKKIADGVNFGFITEKEYEELIHCQHFLWRVRFALHMIAHKREERLLFDYQVKLATLFGYTDNQQSLAIEQFMKTYFTVIKRTRELNEMLIQWFAEVIIHQQKQTITPLDTFFQLSNNSIEVKHPKIFAEHPFALLGIFLWIAKNPSIVDVRASTIRLIRQHLYLINDRFRSSREATSTFLAILQSTNPYEAIHRMSRYGVMGQYLRCFAMVTGQMQYDLFHVYTVDQHTIFVIRNLTRFLNVTYNAQFPLCARVMQNLQKKELLYLAAFFHDIAKGRGGDHSELGAIEVEQFAAIYQLKQEDKKLLIWLVRNHLLMSQTAQRQDIYDPKTVRIFCNQLPQPKYLDFLYLLTVADICGTNPALWNAWKDSLLKELYFAAMRLMHQEKVLNDETMIEKRQQQALEILRRNQVNAEEVISLWCNFKRKYFLQETAESIARHTEAILHCKQFPLILIMPHHSLGGTEIFIYMPHLDERFTITTMILNNHHVTIQEATILKCDNQFDLDTYIILDENNQAFFTERRIAEIHHSLSYHLTHPTPLPFIVQRRISRTQAHFRLTPQITFSQNDDLQQTRMFLVSSDRSGLLATISSIFLKTHITMHNAKIATAGERVEDTFYITSLQGKMLNSVEEELLRQAIIAELQ